MNSKKVVYPFPVLTVSVPGGCSINYMDVGKGEQTLLLIHGLANYAPVWKKNIEVLSAHYRCIAIDLPGNGLSDKNDHPYSMAFFADSVFHFIQTLNLTNVVLVGHSMGGMVAMTAALKYPDICQKMILCAPAGFEVFTQVEKSMYYGMIQLVDLMTTDELSLRKTLEASFYKPQSQIDQVIKELALIIKTYKPSQYKKMVEACIRSMLEDAVFDKLSQIKPRTLVIFGNRDALIPNKLIHHTTTEQLAQKAVKLMPAAKLEIIKDCGHFVHWEKAEVVNGLVEGFLK